MPKYTADYTREMESEDIAHVARAIEMELRGATAKFGPFRSAHEGYAILKEEVDELWDDIKANRLEEARQEAVQVAAMAMRFLLDVRAPKAE